MFDPFGTNGVGTNQILVYAYPEDQIKIANDWIEKASHVPLVKQNAVRQQMRHVARVAVFLLNRAQELEEYRRNQRLAPMHETEIRRRP